MINHWQCNRYETRLLIPVIFVLLFGLSQGCSTDPLNGEKPNILWITSEDMNAFLRCYGDSLATTPNLDLLAEQGSRYVNAFATAPVCSPSRSCIVTGQYAVSLGTQHLRSRQPIPNQIIPFPKYLKNAGYYCSNNGKEDYNFTDSTIWDESSTEAHWRKRNGNMPFFSVFNIETTHQSQIFGDDPHFEEMYGRFLSDEERHDPDDIHLPSYHMDSPVVRKLWARYYDLITLMDRQVGEILKELEADGLAENTIVFYYSDHGTGMPRSKRALYDSGLRVPLIIRAPEKWRNALGLDPGSVSEEMVSFVDFAPTVLNLCGIEPPSEMQGIPFLGKDKMKQEYVYGHADRVDEAYELSRTVRDQRFRYVRNYMPQLPLIQDNFFTDQSEIMRELRRLAELGEMTSAQATMWEPYRVPEELYDTDLYEYERILNRFRREHKSWISRVKDTGFMHEIDMQKQADGHTVFEAAQDSVNFPVEEILEFMDRQLDESWFETDIYPDLRNENSIVRYWATVMLDMKEWQKDDTQALLEDLLVDESLSVRIAAAKALNKYEAHEGGIHELLNLLNHERGEVTLYAARTIQQLFPKIPVLHSPVINHYKAHCPEENWDHYYDLYTCWAIQEAIASTINQ
jgi:arylsulfatase A-like enzyme